MSWSLLFSFRVCEFVMFRWLDRITLFRDISFMVRLFPSIIILFLFPRVYGFGFFSNARLGIASGSRD
jgi:hypothetical protein